MTEQELLQENEKLNGRLQKAITVFGEQKATITRLTEERDSANADIEKLKNRITELEAKVNAASENDAKFFEQVNEIQVLERRVHKLESDCEDAYDKIAQKEQEVRDAQAEATAFHAQVDATAKLLADNEALNDQKLKALNDIIEENKAALEESQKQNETLNERLANAATKFKEQSSIIESQDEDIDNLRSDVDNLNNELNDLKVDYNASVNELAAVREAYEKSQNMLAETQSKMDAHVAELKATIVEKDSVINDLKNKHAATQTQIVEVKTKIQEINRLGSDLITDFNMFA